MSRQSIALIATILLVSAAVVCILVGLAIGQARKAELGPDHPGVSLTTPPLAPAPPAFPAHQPVITPQPGSQRDVGRHHEDTVRSVPPGWMPPTGAARLRSLEETQLMQPGRKEGGSL